MIVVTPPHLKTSDDVAIAYINQLRDRHAMDQHMLMMSHPEEKTLARLSEIRAKNIELEATNRELTGACNSLNTFVDGMERGAETLKAELKAAREYIALLLNQINDITIQKTADVMPKVYSMSDEQKALSKAHATTARPKRMVYREIDGDEAIKAGRDALNKHNREAEQAGQGEYQP